jgi:hypothetical protein
MNFLQPAYLAALAAVSLPLLIHLLSRRRVPDILFSSLRFLKPSDKRSVKRIKLRRLILLLLRMAAIALIVLAFARPVIRGGLAALFPGREPKAVCILLDRSYSMSVLESGGTVLERAKAAVEVILEGLGEADDVTLVAFDEMQEIVFEADGRGGEAAREALGEVEASWMETDLVAAVSKGIGILEGKQRRTKELFIISDFQESSLRGSGRRAESVIRAFLVPVRAEAGPNIAVERILAPRSAVHRGEAVELRVFLRNTLIELPASVSLRVTVGGASVLEKEAYIPAGGSIEELLRFNADRTGWMLGEVSCREDRLRADDTRRFALLVREKANVLLISRTDRFYLRQAISPEGADGDIVLTTRGWNDYDSSDLRGSDVVVIGDGGGTGGSDARLLGNFATGGGRVVLFLAPGTETLAGRLSGHRVKIERPGRDSGFVTIETASDVPEILGPFDSEDIASLGKLKLRGAPYIRGVPDSDVLLRLSSGYPFVWREMKGEGELVFIAFDPAAGSGELVLSPMFLPLVQQLVLASSGGEPAGEGGAVGGYVDLPRAAGDRCRITYPDGREMVAGRLRIPAGEEPGFLAAECGEDDVHYIAINPRCERESDLGQISPAAAADSLGLQHWTVSEGGEGIGRTVSEAREGREISVSLVTAAIIILVIELFVAQHMKRFEEAERA